MTTIDDLDRALVHALHVDARAPWRRIAEVIGTSTQTVARRYAKLRTDAGLRVVGLPDPAATGHQQWIVRLGAATHTAVDIARALARRPETSWVRLLSGGTEITAVVRTAAGADDAHTLLLRDIPRTSGITAVSAHYLLHMYRGGPTAWRGRADVLSPDQEDLLRVPMTEGVPVTGAVPVPLGARDHRMLEVLRHDGRAGLADLADATGWTAATVARRLDDLRRAGAIFFDVDLDPVHLGIRVIAALWMSVAPAHVERVATELAGHDELAVVAATTGRTNLLANVLCPDPAALHHYLTTRIALDAITSVETAPVLRTLKGVAPMG